MSNFERIQKIWHRLRNLLHSLVNQSATHSINIKQEIHVTSVANIEFVKKGTKFWSKKLLLELVAISCSYNRYILYLDRILHTMELLLATFSKNLLFMFSVEYWKENLLDNWKQKFTMKCKSSIPVLENNKNLLYLFKVDGWRLLK